MWTRIGGQTKVALVRTSLGEAFKAYEDRIAFGLVAFGHRQGKTCVEPELMAKPGELTSKTPGKLLFGAFTVTDAYFAPVVMRFLTYAVTLPPAARDYVEAVRALPAVAQWMEAARGETAFVAADEPYAAKP